MFTVEEALRAVLERCGPLPPRSRSLVDALGCVLAEDVAADVDMPPFDKSVVDGYAVRTADLAGSDRWLRIGEEITAGRMPTRALAPREAAAIMTGAPLPEGADAVVMIERTRLQNDGVVVDDPSLTPGRNWLPRGREGRAGDLVLRRGERINPARVGLLASVGRLQATVVPRPRVAILPTGDELVEPDVVPGPGQIRNSNAALLRALTMTSDAEAEVLPIAPDEPQHLRDALHRGLRADVLVITGGVSAGTRDLVPVALRDQGVIQVFHKVRVKPGKPLWFGVGPARGESPGPLVFGLPGNPISGVVSFLLFVRPALAILGASAARLPLVTEHRLAASFTHTGERPSYHPARWMEPTEAESVGSVEPLAWAGSADLRTVAQADGFAIFPAGDRTYAAGESVGFLPWSDFTRMRGSC